MKKKLSKKAVRIIILLAVVFLVFNLLNSRKESVNEVKVKDYMPAKKMVKIFSGGFEESGSVEVIDKIQGEFYQKKISDTATSVATVYQITKDRYKVVYRSGENEKVKEDYIDEKQNLDLTMLRTPIKKGVSWINPDDSTYKIISIEEKIKVAGKEMVTIKLRYRKEGSEYYIYFAKGLGVVRIDSEMGNSILEDIEYNVKDYLKKKDKLNK